MRLEVTAANIHDAAGPAAVLPSESGKIYGDSAFGGSRSADAIRGLRRMRWIGLGKAGLQVRLAAIAYNLWCTLTLRGLI